MISIVDFRLFGGNLLSLHDESRQRRAKEREDNRSERFSSLLGTSHLSTARGSPPSLKRRWLTDTLSQRGSRGLEI